MATATERVSVLMTTTEKKQAMNKALKTGVSVGEYVRRAIKNYRADEDDQTLMAMIEQMNQATAKAETAIDDALIFVAESNARIAKMEAKKQSHQQ
jgi:hypothetical protein